MNPSDSKKPQTASRSSQAIRCIHCGPEQNFASGVMAVLCRSGSTRITLVGTQKDIAETPKVRPQSTARQREGMHRHSRKRPVLQGQALLAELHALEKRLSRIGAFVPFLGPWLVRWHDVKTPQERKQLRRRCFLAADVALSLLLIAARPHSAPPDARAEADIRVLGGIIEEFRARNGSYPDPAPWGRTLDLGDRRYVDP
jgi:hypothetical protein